MAALTGLVLTALLWVVGVGVLMIPATLRAVHTVADRERVRLSRWGPAVAGAEPISDGLRSPAARRELGWVAVHATAGLALGLAGVLLLASSSVGV